MSHTFDQSKDAIARLVEHFAVNRNAYLAPHYKEAHARQEFIDPFFEALNWDVHNHQHAAPDYREVVVEDSLEIEGQAKAPDYAFRVGRGRGRTRAAAGDDRFHGQADRWAGVRVV